MASCDKDMAEKGGRHSLISAGLGQKSRFPVQPLLMPAEGSFLLPLGEGESSSSLLSLRQCLHGLGGWCLVTAGRWWKSRFSTRPPLTPLWGGGGMPHDHWVRWKCRLPIGPSVSVPWLGRRTGLGASLWPQEGGNLGFLVAWVGVRPQCSVCGIWL